MFGMKGFHVSASGAIQGHHGPLVPFPTVRSNPSGELSFIFSKFEIVVANLFSLEHREILFGKGIVINPLPDDIF